MPDFAAPVERLIEELKHLPGIGQKTAQRLAFHILRAPPEYATELVNALQEVKSKVRLCTRCFSLTEGQLCGFCTDPRRDDRLLCVVEGIADLMALEKTREFKGRYHVLWGALSPLKGIGPDEIEVASLLKRVTPEVHEVILATNPNVEGEATALYLARVLRPSGARVTRIAFGLPVGGDIEYADEVTMARSLENRREL